MAVIRGEIDSLKQLQAYLKAEGISFLSSIDKIIYFKNNYNTKMAEKEARVKAEAKHEINLELKAKENEITSLEKAYNKNLLKLENLLAEEKHNLLAKIEKLSSKHNKLSAFIKIYFLRKKESKLNKKLDKERKKLAKTLKIEINSKNKDLNHIKNNYNNLVDKKVALELSTLKKAKAVLDYHNDLFLGAIGEQKALNALKELPDSFTIINNFKLHLNKPIYNKRTDERIYSIQADHIVVGPSGVFLIETKNWSKASINNSSLYSPVEQVKRASFGLFCYLNNSNRSFLQSRWGKKTIPIKNIVLMIGAKPKGAFEYVKVLSLYQVCKYIIYFKPVFNQEEVDEVLDLLTNVRNNYTPKAKRYKNTRYQPIINYRSIKRFSRWL